MGVKQYHEKNSSIIYNINNNCIQYTLYIITFTQNKKHNINEFYNS